MPSENETSPVVQTTHGKVRGALLKSPYCSPFYAFDGVPYAQPPVGSLRFKEPREVKPWSGILDCTQPPNFCLQSEKYVGKVKGSEDCLYLNISVKTFRSAKPLPIMVYVHGGAFRRGDNLRQSMGPDYLMTEDVIYIAIGFRLGAFGYLSFSDPSLGIPGNAGLKDIIQALRWIKANAGNFNGDPERVTLFGHSSGSVSVQWLLASPQTEGLFQKAIPMAGYCMELYRLPNLEYRLAKNLGYEGENIDKKVYEFLLKADPNKLAMADVLTPEEKKKGEILDFIPCVEPYATSGAVVLAAPTELLRTSWSNRIPIVLGTCSEDGLYHVMGLKNDGAKVLPAFQEYPERVLPWTLKWHYDSDQKRQVGEQFLDYFCQAHGNQLTLEHADALEKLFTHNLVHSQNRLILSRLAYAKAPTYLYRFAFDSPDFNLYRKRCFLDVNQRGVCHVDELSYLFVMPTTFKLEKSRPEYTAICRMVAMWVSFASTSDPNCAITKPLVNWKPLTQSEPHLLLNIDEELKIIPQPEFSKLKFYDRLYDQADIPLF
ncbi:esterase B1-like [Drosophila ananassae]|uniref:esterase B1-like n=1 Tax=Drosophila ananassae TaxID=7217 RepID=UPI0013A5D649|nr:esterase B1-like [Drosophila ananassae]XP_032312237.1 esterase B1-like [Drosophila ananassae]